MRSKFKSYCVSIVLLFCLFSITVTAQFFNPSFFGSNVSIGKRIFAENSALLELGENPTNKGLILPRVMHPDSVKNSVAGLIVYSLHNESLYFRTSAGWIKLCTCGLIEPPEMRFIVHPQSVTVSSGVAYSLSGTVQYGTGPYIWEWYLLGTSGSVFTSTTSIPTVSKLMSGATSDEYWYLKCSTSANGTIFSDTAHITVNSSPSFTYGYSTTNPYIDNSTAPSIGSAITTPITSGTNIVFSLPAAAADKFWIVKELASQPPKVSWYHNTDNSGTIPGDVVRVWTVGLYRYYSSRTEFTLTYTDPIQLLQ